mgnify:CR=1 FL=1
MSFDYEAGPEFYGDIAAGISRSIGPDGAIFFIVAVGILTISNSEFGSKKTIRFAMHTYSLDIFHITKNCMTHYAR